MVSFADPSLHNRVLFVNPNIIYKGKNIAVDTEQKFHQFYI